MTFSVSQFDSYIRGQETIQYLTESIREQLLQLFFFFFDVERYLQ